MCEFCPVEGSCGVCGRVPIAVGSRVGFLLRGRVGRAASGVVEESGADWVTVRVGEVERRADLGSVGRRFVVPSDWVQSVA